MLTPGEGMQLWTYSDIIEDLANQYTHKGYLSIYTVNNVG